jgi:ribosomal protein S18 acetylase RimI-like enzyme
MPYRLREYTPADRDACLAVFASNTPTFFREHEQARFADFLDRMPCPYFVVEDEDGRVIGCGGYAPRRGTLCYGMVSRHLHRQGVGMFLLRERLRHWFKGQGPVVVRVNTSQHASGFFERAGFLTTRVVPDGYAPGLDRYEMELPLDKARYQELDCQTRLLP